MNLEPLGDRLIIQPESAPEVTEGGIIVPDTIQEKPLQGVVVSVGPGKRDDNGKRIGMDVEVGNTVLYAKYSGTDARIGDIEYLILNEHDVLAKVKDE
jgi:chaperonin GroES